MRWKAALCGLAALILVRCEFQTAGTSVGTGNPTEIEVAFKDDSGPVPVTGTLAVYASTQIPVPGFSPEPLLKMDVAGATRASVKAGALASLPDSLWPKGSVENGLYRFNVVVTGEDEGTILRGLTFRKQEGDFVLRAEDSAARSEDKATVMGRMAGLVEYEGKMDTTSFSKDWDYYLYLVGTGFAAKALQGKFSFPSIPAGVHEGFIVPLPGKDHPLSSNESTFIFALISPLNTASDTLLLGSIRDTIPMPDSLIIK